jgi:hypothetical protein
MTFDEDRMIKIVQIVFAICILITVCSCSLSDEKEEAQRIAESFLDERIANGGFEGKKEFYSKLFWNYTNEEDWNNLKFRVDITFGNIKKYSLISRSVKSGTFAGKPPGTYAVLLYSTEYEKGNGQEKLSMYKSDNGESFKIIGHRIEQK